MTFSLDDNLFAGYLCTSWQMSFDQRLSFIGILSQIQPEISIEIGTFRAGSLSAISKFSQYVYSIDIDPDIPEKYGHHFDNVDFSTGYSQDILPSLLAKISEDDKHLEFVLIDGDHSTAGVQRDCNLILSYIPTKPIYIVMHDTFNPAVRRGILQADWSNNPYVHQLHLDFVPGTFQDNPSAHNYKELWGGLGLAIMLPDKRNTPLDIIERCHLSHEILLNNSAHYQDLQGIHKLFAGIRRFIRKYT